jgi:hypothetical protein
MDFNSATPDWSTPAGRLLEKLAQTLPPTPPRAIIVFGSAPLQIFLDSGFLSQDCNLIGDETLASFCFGLSIPSASGDLSFQVCDPLTFRSTANWETRAVRHGLHGHTFVFPHPWDILVSKIGRLEPKDIEAFRLVIRKTGEPTEAQFKNHLQLAVDLYRPSFDEEQPRDYVLQTQHLWAEVFGEMIDVHAEIIRPAVQRRNRQYEADSGEPADKERLKVLGDESRIRDA